MEIPNEGKYNCKLSGQIVIYEAGTGSLCAAVPCVMVDSGFTFKHTQVIIKADGTVMTKSMDTFKSIFAWDGLDPFWLMDSSADGGALREVEFEIVGGPETGDKGGTYFKSKWMNPLGGGMATPEAANRQNVLAKYGSKLRALAGSAPAPKPATPKAPAAPKAPAHPKPAPTAPPSGAPTATMEEAWNAVCAANTGKDAGEIEKVWFDTIGKLFPNKSNTDLKPHEWGKIKAEFDDAIPM